MAKNSLAIVSCIKDWVWDSVSDFTANKKGNLTHLRISIFGSVKNREVVMGQLRTISNPLKLQKVNLVAHQGCLAYADRKFPNPDLEMEALENDLRNTKAAIIAEMPTLKVKTFILTKNKSIKKVE